MHGCARSRGRARKRAPVARVAGGARAQGEGLGVARNANPAARARGRKVAVRAGEGAVRDDDRSRRRSIAEPHSGSQIRVALCAAPARNRGIRADSKINAVDAEAPLLGAGGCGAAANSVVSSVDGAIY